MIYKRLRDPYGKAGQGDEKDVYATIDIAASPGIPSMRWIYTTRKYYLLMSPEFVSFISFGMIAPTEIIHLRIRMLNGDCENITTVLDSKTNKPNSPLSLGEMNDVADITPAFLEEVYLRLWKVLVPWPQEVLNGDLVALFHNQTYSDFERHVTMVAFSPFASNGVPGKLFSAGIAFATHFSYFVIVIGSIILALHLVRLASKATFNFIIRTKVDIELKRSLHFLKQYSSWAKCR